jgi:hypothetical protein
MLYGVHYDPNEAGTFAEFATGYDVKQDDLVVDSVPESGRQVLPPSVHYSE